MRDFRPVRPHRRYSIASLAIGFTGAELELDGCGQWKVFYDSIDSLEQGESLAEQVRAAGFEARVEVED